MIQKNILIYPHQRYDIGDGGITVQYYLANLLEKYGQTVRIHPYLGSIDNELFTKYYNDEFPIDSNCVVIYCEGIIGNPLNASNVVRWMLSKRGQNTPYNRVDGWGRNDLVYFFNSEDMINENPEKVNTIYKFLSPLFLNPIFNMYVPRHHRSGYCYSLRKHFIHKNGYKKIHPQYAYELPHLLTHNELVTVFNKFDTHVSYDPISFISIMAPICGCISIVHPIDGVDELKWIKMGGVKEYIELNNIQKLYGISYGVENIELAKNTVHLAKQQWEDITQYYIRKHIPSFIEDISNLENNVNTVENVYFQV